MNYKKFVDEYNVANDKAKYVQKHIVNCYIPYEDKIAQCQKIVDVTSHKTVNIDGKERVIYCQNSAMQYMLFVMQMISNYTDIEWNKETGENNELLTVFNMFNKYGIIDDLITLFPHREHAMFIKTLENVSNDVYENERSIPSYLETKFETLSLSLTELINNAPSK